jgi:hypothetical protein
LRPQAEYQIGAIKSIQDLRELTTDSFVKKYC